MGFFPVLAGAVPVVSSRPHLLSLHPQEPLRHPSAQVFMEAAEDLVQFLEMLRGGGGGGHGAGRSRAAGAEILGPGPALLRRQPPSPSRHPAATAATVPDEALPGAAARCSGGTPIPACRHDGAPGIKSLTES